MSALQTLLDNYRQGSPFPTYAQLIGLCTGSEPLNELLRAYRHGAPFPTYAQLAAIAYPEPVQA